MMERDSASSPYARCVELLFSRMDEPASPLPAAGRAPVRPGGTLPQDWPSKPPPLETPEDLRAAYEWFCGERQQLEEYTRSQLAFIQQEHFNVLGRHYQIEAEIGRRTQEINREMQFLATHVEALRERSRGLAEWEEALTAQTERFAGLEEGRVTQTDEERAAALAALRAEIANRRLSEAAARAKLEATQALLRERQAVWEKKQAEVLARQRQLERRCLELERAEEALKRRIAELDEVEERLLRDADDPPSGEWTNARPQAAYRTNAK